MNFQAIKKIIGLRSNTPEDKVKVKQIIDLLKEENKAIEFLEPVDYNSRSILTTALGLTNYRKIIKKPMDLSTVTSNLAKSKYKKLINAFEDIQLIWDNCMEYNIEQSVKDWLTLGYL